MEKYLSCISINKFRISLSRFRLSSHDSAIEKGRHSNIEREQRKCIYCNMKVIETEFHFLLSLNNIYLRKILTCIYKKYIDRISLKVNDLL